MQNPLVMIETFVSFILALSLHEYGHGLMARMLGDPTPLRNGRLSLSPARHLTMVGTLVAIVSSIAVLGGVGWGKQLDYDATKMRVHPNVGTALVGAAGIITNALVGGLVAFGLRFLPGADLVAVQFDTVCGGPGAQGGVQQGAMLQSCLNPVIPAWALYLEQFAVVFAIGNIVLALINLIPCSPLDGYTILYAFLPDAPAIWLRKLVPVMEFILLIFFFLIPYLLRLVGFGFDPSAIFTALAKQLTLAVAGPAYGFYSAI